MSDTNFTPPAGGISWAGVAEHGRGDHGDGDRARSGQRSARKQRVLAGLHSTAADQRRSSRPPGDSQLGRGP